MKIQLIVACACALAFETALADDSIFIMDEDNDHYFKNPSSMMTEAALESYVDNLAAGGKVTHFFMCPTGGRASFNSKVWEPIWKGLEESPRENIFYLYRTWAENAKLLFDRGIDPYTVWIRRCRERGISPWLSPRMNDAHDGACSPRPFFRNTTFWRTRRDLHCYPNYEKPSWRHHQFDYSHAEVRESALAMIRELFERYDVDGLNIHANGWFPRETARASAPVMTAFMREVRRLADEWGKRRGHRIGLSVCRAGFTPDDCRARGFDAAEMAREGLLDIIVCHSDGGDGFDGILPVELWRKEVGSASVKIVVGRGERMFQGSNRARHPVFDYTADMFRGWADRQFSAGVDGVYLFNVEYEPKTWRDVCRTGLSLADLPRTTRVYPAITDTLPLSLDAAASFTINVGSVTQGVVTVVAGFRKTASAGLAVRLNGVLSIADEATRVHHEFFNECRPGAEQTVPLDVPGRRWFFPASSLRKGDNHIEIPAVPGELLVYLELGLSPRD